jgi:ribosomal protein L16 Arg81 hydroxylase
MSDTESVEEVVEAEVGQAMDQMVNEPIENINETSTEQQEEQKVPLSALQKERRKRQEAEQRAKLYEDMQAQQLRERQQSQSVQEPEDEYEPVTKSELSKRDELILRRVEEAAWIRNNPEKAAELAEKLTDFLNQKPNLQLAIEAKTNRYEEAWNLMNAMTSKQKLALKPATIQKKEAPGSPATLPKAAGMNEAINFMSMNDSEFNAWRQAKMQRR